jgi:putative ABC transport system permease protein
VLIFAALLTMATALIFDIAPAWSGSRTDVNTGLRTAGRGAISSGNRLTRALIAAEISLSLMLLSGAGLLMRSVLKFSTAPLGFDPDRVMVASLTLPPQHYAGAAEKLRFYDDLRTRLNAIPGASGSAIATTMPPYGSGTQEVEVEGRTRTGVMDVGADMVSPEYFRVLGIALRRGRVFDRDDGPNSSAVAVVNEKFAAEYLPDVDPIGRRVRLFGNQEGPWLTVVGVAATEKRPELMHEMSWHESPAIYRPISQAPAASITIALRTAGDQADTGRAMDRAVSGIDQEIPLSEVSAMRDLLGTFLKYPHFRAMVIAQFAGLALLLAALGLHGLLSQYVTQRTRELGLRMAIGARTGDILRLIAVQGGVPVLAGVALGMVSTVALTGYLTSLLFEVSPGDPLTMIAAPLALLAVAIAAMAKPALDAAAVDPMEALRDE